MKQVAIDGPSRSWVGASQRGVAVLCLTIGTACSTTPSANLRALAVDPPTPCSVLVTGGTFLSPRQSADEVLAWTFTVADAADVQEPIGLERVIAALRTARTFARVELDLRGPAQRREFAADGGTVSVEDDAVREFLVAAAAAGHDYLLLVDRLVDGPVLEFGINSRWPITVIAWLALGVGMVIPDHTFESSAELRISLRDVHSGEVIYRRVFDGDPIDLSLIDRSDFLGFLSSILVPPFWVGSDDERVLEHVRRATSARLLYRLAEDLKGTAFRDQLLARAPAEIRLQRAADGRLRIRLRAVEGVSIIRMRVDGQRFEGPVWDAFARRLLDRAEIVADGSSSYEAVLAEPVTGRFVQVLVQTVGGRVASTTIDLRSEEEGRR